MPAVRKCRTIYFLLSRYLFVFNSHTHSFCITSHSFIFAGMETLFSPLRVSRAFIHKLHTHPSKASASLPVPVISNQIELASPR